MARILADIDSTEWEDESRQASRHLDRDVHDGSMDRPGVRTHEAMLDLTDGTDVRHNPVQAPGRPMKYCEWSKKYTYVLMYIHAEDTFHLPDDLVDGDLQDYELDGEGRILSLSTVSPSGHKDCRTLFPERNTKNPSLVRQWFDPIPSFWAGVAGCQVRLMPLSKPLPLFS